MTKEELEKATGQELIEERNYCGADGYYGDYLDNVNAEMLKRFNRLADLEKENAELRNNGFTVSAMTEQQLKVAIEKGEQLEKENAKLKSIAEFQQSSNMKRHFEIKKLEKENAELKAIERMALYSQLSEQLTKAKDLIEDMYDKIPASHSEYYKDVMERARQFLQEIEK